MEEWNSENSYDEIDIGLKRVFYTVHSVFYVWIVALVSSVFAVVTIGLPILFFLCYWSSRFKRILSARKVQLTTFNELLEKRLNKVEKRLKAQDERMLKEDKQMRENLHSLAGKVSSQKSRKNEGARK
jgi:sensor histidine kinase YesM